MTAAPPLLVLAGATATGKTGLSIRLALALRERGQHVEIVSADSRQVFRGLDVGTAKLPVEERRGIAHHGLDLVDPDEAFSVAAFARHAAGALEGIERAGGVAILVGGTGLYLRAVTGAIDALALPSDPIVRAAVEERLATAGLPAAVERLRRLAPTAAGRIDLRNPRRVARALEVAEIAGDVPLPMGSGYPGPIAWLGLTIRRDVHRGWIADRARQQFESGLLDEAARLRARYPTGLCCFSAIGYREAWAVLDGALTVDQAVEIDASRNLAFAKRQATWFRAEPAIRWLDPSTGDPFGVALATAEGLIAARD